MSVLRAIAYLAHTRMDILVFVSALQRVNSKPQVQHVKKLNKLLMWVQRHPKKLTYKRMKNSSGGASAGEAAKSKPGDTHLRVVSDAAFECETDNGHSMHGALFMRAPGGKTSDFVEAHACVHLLDWVCKSQRHVTRSTFAAELLAVGDATDHH